MKDNISISKVVRICCQGERNTLYPLIKESKNPIVKFINSLFDEEDIKESNISKEIEEEIEEEIEKMWSICTDKYTLERIIKGTKKVYKERLLEESKFFKSPVASWVYEQKDILSLLKEYHPYSEEIAEGILDLSYKGLIREKTIGFNEHNRPYISLDDLIEIGQVNTLAANTLLPLYHHGVDGFSEEDLQTLFELGVPFAARELGRRFTLPKDISKSIISSWVVGVCSKIPTIDLNELKGKWKEGNIAERYSWYCYYHDINSPIHPLKPLRYKKGLTLVSDPENPLGEDITLFELLTGLRGALLVPDVLEIIPILKELESKYTNSFQYEEDNEDLDEF